MFNYEKGMFTYYWWRELYECSK